MSFDPQHRAFYDDDGNIILPAWTVDPSPEDEKLQEPARILPRLTHLRSLFRRLLNEGATELQASIDDGRDTWKQGTREWEGWMKRLRRFLLQPVWVSGRRNTVKQYSRASLFLLDTVRFGGTFAVIFALLFVGLNYESFFQIAKARVAEFMVPPSLVAATGKPFAIALRAPSSRSLARFLPPAGPPENRIIIPTLRLNVPLVEPPMTSILEQDWGKVEEDIQTSLQHGVVHYPGTAKPGQAGNFFVTGHSSYYAWAPGKYKAVFARLSELQAGDEYWVYFGGDKHRYRVESKREVRPSDISVLDQPATKRLSTLMTCTPVGTTLRRLVVVAEEVDPVTGLALQVGEKGTVEHLVSKMQIEALPI